MASVVSNLPEVIAGLTRVGIQVEAADEVTERTAAEIVAARAAQLAPRLTGHLAASTDDSGGLVIANTDYAGYVEYGSRHNKAQPFMRPAKDQMEPVVREAAERIYTTATR